MLPANGDRRVRDVANLSRRLALLRAKDQYCRASRFPRVNSTSSRGLGLPQGAITSGKPPSPQAPCRYGVPPTRTRRCRYSRVGAEIVKCWQLPAVSLDTLNCEASIEDCHAASSLAANTAGPRASADAVHDAAARQI